MENRRRTEVLGEGAGRKSLHVIVMGFQTSHAGVCLSNLSLHSIVHHFWADVPARMTSSKFHPIRRTLFLPVPTTFA